MEQIDPRMLKLTRIANAIMSFKGMQIKQLAAKADLSPPNLSVWFNGKRKNILSNERIAQLFKVLGLEVPWPLDEPIFNCSLLHQWDIPLKYKTLPFSKDLTVVLELLSTELVTTENLMIFMLKDPDELILRLKTSSGNLFIHVNAAFNILPAINKFFADNTTTVQVGQIALPSDNLIISIAELLSKHLSKEDLVEFKKLKVGNSNNIDHANLINLINERDLKLAYDAMKNYVNKHENFYTKLEKAITSSKDLNSEISKWQVELANIKNYADRCHMQLFKIKQIIQDH